MKILMKLSRPVIAVVLAIGLYSSCNSLKELTCALLASTATGPAVDMTITFKAEQTGDGVITSLTYTTSSGVVTISNPKLPWTATAPALANTEVRIIATGNVKKGSLRISYEGTSGGNEIKGNDFCSQE